ncbi:MAG: hypothetical protein H6Q67_548 [Firmicutes bacterium]|nr:hypothetical protein [Bacillota bacterium]
MKKTLFALLMALVLVFGVTGFAYAGPFADVAANNWAYNAINQLAKAGIIDGYGDGVFHGDKTITRYEMAIIVAKAIEHADKADAVNKALIDKLAAEYADELNSLGVRVAKLEDKTKVALTYESRIRYTHDGNKATGSTNNGIGTNAFDWRQRIWLGGAVNDNVTYGARIEATNGTFGSGSALSTGFNRAWFEAKNFMGSFDSARIGRFGTYNYTNGLLSGKSSNCDGVILTKKISDKATFAGLLFDTGANSEVKLLNVDYKPNSNLKYNFAYEDANFSAGTWPLSSSTDLTNGLKTRSYDFGTQMKLGNLRLTGEYVYTKDITAGNIGRKAYAFQLTNGVMPYFFPNALIVDSTKAHTDAWAVIYRSIDNHAVPVTSTFSGYQVVFTGYENGVNGTGLAQDNDVKGWSAEYQNVVSKNVVWTIEVQSLKQKSTPNAGTATAKDVVWDTSLQFIF